MLAAIVSQNSFVLVFAGGIAQLSRDTLQNGVSHRCACVKLSTKPKGPFGTKTAIALRIVVKYYRGSILLSIPIRCHFS